MPRTRKNVLSLTEATDEQGNRLRDRQGRELWALTGRFQGKRYRRRHWDFAALQNAKAAMDRVTIRKANEAVAVAEARADMLSRSQVIDARAAYDRLPRDKTLMEAVLICIERYWGKGDKKSCIEAKDDWVKELKLRRRGRPGLAVHAHHTQNRLQQFLHFTFGESADKRMLGDITPQHCKDFIYRKEVNMNSGANDAAALHAWLQWAVTKRWLLENPVQDSAKNMRKEAKHQLLASPHAPKALTPEQCSRLLQAAITDAHEWAPYETDPWKQCGLVPYVLLSLWTFVRRAEVFRLTADNVHQLVRGWEPRLNLMGEKIGSAPRSPEVPPCIRTLLVECIKRGCIREVTPIKRKNRKGEEVEIMPPTIYFSARRWLRVRALAGITVLDQPIEAYRNKIKQDEMVSNIMRHTGMSYLWQSIRNEDMKRDPHATEKHAADVVTAQAGNTEEIAYKHYLRRVSQNACDRFFSITGTLDFAALPQAEIIPMATATAEAASS